MLTNFLMNSTRKCKIKNAHKISSRINVPAPGLGHSSNVHFSAQNVGTLVQVITEHYSPAWLYDEMMAMLTEKIAGVEWSSR